MCVSFFRALDKMFAINCSRYGSMKSIENVCSSLVPNDIIPSQFLAFA